MQRASSYTINKLLFATSNKIDEKSKDGMGWMAIRTISLVRIKNFHHNVAENFKAGFVSNLYFAINSRDCIMVSQHLKAIRL